MYCKPIILGPNGKVPVYKTKQAACADVFLPEDVTIEPGKVACPGLQLGFEIPAGNKIVLYPRSSLLVKFGIIQPTSIIDADYSGMEIHAPLYNATDKPVTLKAGDRVAQIELQPYTRVLDWKFESNERTGGFGSTGEK
jgi:dUTP pyrophosphatase